MWVMVGTLGQEAWAALRPLATDGTALRVAAGSAFLSGVWWLFQTCHLRLHRVRRASWWDPAWQIDKELEWSEVLRLVRYGGDDGECGLGQDPLAFSPRPRSALAMAGYSVRLLAMLLIFGSATIAVLAFLVEPRIPEVFRYGNSEPMQANAALNLSGNLTALLALVAASISIVFTYHQLQAKVRADNRQEWLGRLRKTLAQVLALAGEHGKPGLTCRRRATILRKLDPARLELELLLNPSEKDHRLLMFLIQQLAFLRSDGLEGIDDARELKKAVKMSIRREICRSKWSREEPLEHVVDWRYGREWSSVLEKPGAADLITYAMRLSHVVLKREWERVKWTR